MTRRLERQLQCEAIRYGEDPIERIHQADQISCEVLDTIQVEEYALAYEGMERWAQSENEVVVTWAERTAESLEHS